MKKVKSFLLCLVVLLLVLAGMNAPALAEYPEKKVRVVCPQTAGGGADLATRLLVQYANPYLGDRLYVENVTGGGGAIGLREAIKAPPDGYTLVSLVTNSTIGPFTIKNFPTSDTYERLCLVATDPCTLAVKTDSPFKNIEDFLIYNKAHPDEITTGHAGTGAANYLATLAFTSAANIRLSLIPFKGSAPALVAAMGGHVDSVTAGCSEVLKYYEGKKLRPLVTFGEKRSRLYPDVPTLKELGYDVTFSLWRGMGAPRGIPENVIAILADAFRKATENKQFIERTEKSGLELHFLGPKEAHIWMNAQYEANKALTAKVGLKPR